MNAQSWIMLGGFALTIATVLVGIGVAWGSKTAAIKAADERFAQHAVEDGHRHEENVRRLSRLEAKVDLVNGSIAEAKRDIEVLRQRKSSG